ncbi:MAG: class B sortase [Clostridia bacterium]|nr:class B sortase [Clostridia bacterium]
MKGVTAVAEEKKRRRRWLIILILCLLLFVIALGLLAWHLWPGNTPAPVPDEPTAPTTTTTTAVPLPDNPIDFAAKQAENPHIVGWIEIPGTVIDYPVLQSGNDVPENFYLDHDENRKYKFAGSIYMQQMNRADFTHPNTVLYGHNMRNGSMFAALRKYRDKEFFDEHQYIYVYTPGHILTYRIYSAFVYDNRHILNSFNFSKPEEYQLFLDQSLNPRSMTKQVREGVTVTTDDRIITLSTCTGNNRERYLVEGVLIDDQPTK